MISVYCPRAAELTSLIADASNFVNSTFWDPDPIYGVGGWGDPNDDYRVPNGGFSTGFSLSYPLPHRLRRKHPVGSQFDDSVGQITPENVASLVNGFVGTFIGFQAALENGPHGAIHGLVGGCVDSLDLTACRFVRSQGPPRDLGGQCPANAPPDCMGGAKWSSNGSFLTGVHTPIAIVLTF
jgi:tyrosinase